METKIFLSLEAVLYLSFFGAAPHTAVFLKYGSILLCAVYARHGPYAVPLLLTATADWFLLVVEQYLELGILIFIAVQVLYACRIGRDTKRTLFVRTLLVLAFWAILWRLRMITPLNLLAGVYFPQLLCNAALAWRKDRIFALGLVLFIGCDVCVGLWNLAGAAGTGMWAFYLPSQVLIVLSTPISSTLKQRRKTGSSERTEL